jgi:hypothetical protein
MYNADATYKTYATGKEQLGRIYYHFNVYTLAEETTGYQTNPFYLARYVFVVSMEFLYKWSYIGGQSFR